MRASSLPTIRPPCLRSSIVTNNTPNKTLCATSHGDFTRQVLFVIKRFQILHLLYGSCHQISWLYTLYIRFEALPCFIKFKKLVELQLGASIKYLQTDCGGEFTIFKPFLQSCGILHRTSYHHTHEQNGFN